MTNLWETKLYVALVHYPVVNKNGETIASALTNFDLHDIARAAATFGLKGYYVVTPLQDQQELAQAIAKHWQTGFGSAYNPNRQTALNTIRVVASIEDAVADITLQDAQKPIVVATSAAPMAGFVNFGELKASLKSGHPHLLLLGTAWGLHANVFNNVADMVLEPIDADTGYNHLSVRSAAAIMFDRLNR